MERTTNHTLFLFTVLWLVLLSLLTPGECALLVVSLENSCSVTQLCDPDSQWWWQLALTALGEMAWTSRMPLDFYLLPGLESESVESPVWVQYRLTFQITRTTPPGDSILDLRCDWANLGSSEDFSLEISCSACFAPRCVLLQQVWLVHSGRLINVIGGHDDTLVISDPFGH